MRAGWMKRGLTAGAGAMLISAPALAQGDSALMIDRGDTGFILICSALVLFMTLPGLALFYGGLVRAKNFLSVLMHCFAIAALVSLLWALGGYSLAFGTGNGWIGDFSRWGLSHLHDPRPNMSIPENVFALYQMMFAVITPALIVGAFPERVKFGWLMLFSALWLLVVYVPVAHWVWGGGWMAKRGVLDFAGGIVVHTTAGISALVVALMIGSRRGFPNTLIPPHSSALTMVGAGMLWVGWFGFNGGSALAADVHAADALLATHLAAATAALMWAALERAKIGKATSIGLVTGAVAGLATVTPMAGYVAPLGGVIAGAAGAVVCFGAVLFVKQKWRIDDSLDVFAVHGIGGILGSLLLAPLASAAFGGSVPHEGFTIGGQFVAQAIGLSVTLVWSGVATFLLAKLAGLVIPMRVDSEAEHDGLDLHSHGERAYEFD